MIKAARKLVLQVRNVGRVPGSFETHQGYSWVDGAGRSVSPPPEIDRVARYDTSAGTRKSGLMLLKDSDERKVSLALVGFSDSNCRLVVAIHTAAGREHSHPASMAP